MESPADADGQQPAKKRRIPKACASCRRSKLRCDEQRPCTRCIQSGIDCVYFDRPKDPTVERFERIELALGGISDHLSTLSNASSTGAASPATTYQASSADGRSVLGYFASAARDSSTAAAPVSQYDANQASPSASHSSISLASNVGADRSLSWSRRAAGLSSEPIIQASPIGSNGYPPSGSVRRNAGIADFTLRDPSNVDLVTTGFVSEQDAQSYFQSFFEGCDRFVPVFDRTYDTYDSVRSRSCILLDVIVIYGCRAAHGVLSKAYQRLHGLVRQHTSDLVLRMSSAQPSDSSIEHVQALLTLASYSDSGAILCDVALRSAVNIGMPASLDRLFASVVDRSAHANGHDESALYRSARVWFALFVLDQILSLDGVKPPSVTLKTSSRRVRALLSHPRRTALDLRLFSQVELNALRSSSYIAVAGAASASPDREDSIANAITGSVLDLDIWLSEWQGIVYSDPSLSNEHSVMSLNLRIQHAWAILALHLRALTAYGIENIALMTESQRSIALAAKAAAERHLQLLLTNTIVPASSYGTGQQLSQRPYVANFRYAMEFVWAKNAFCVLIVLRLGILLGDTLAQLLARLQEAREFLRELDNVGMGANLSYTRILAQTVDKCERAVKASLQQQGDNGRESTGTSDSGDFQSFIPKEFMFEWDFPGLNLCYIPLDWQDLFLDFGATA